MKTGTGGGWRERNVGRVARWYGALLVLFPREFRDKYGRQLVRAFRDAAADARRNRGRMGLLFVWVRMFAEALGNAPKEHLLERTRRRVNGQGQGQGRGRSTAPSGRPILWHVLRDTAYAVRTLRRSPTFAVVAVVTLALGIGANSAIFSVMYSVTMRPLGYRAPKDLVWLSMAFAENPFPASEPEYLELRDQAQSFDDIAGYLDFTSRVNLGGLDEPQRVPAASVTANFLRVLGVQPQLGRGFAEGDDRPGATPVVVLSYGLWQRSFGGDSAVVGRTTLVNGAAATVVGVMSESFGFPGEHVDVIRMNVIDPTNPAGRASHYLAMIGRLRDGATLESAQSEIAGLTKRWSTEFPNRHGPNERHPLMARGLQERIVGDVRPALLILTGAVSLVLLIACANVANLMLARAEHRQREIAIRKALGASGGRLTSQLLTESAVIGIMGGVIGLGLAAWGVQFLEAAGPAGLPRTEEIRIDAVVLAFTAVVSVGTGLLFGLIPALSASRRDVTAMFREGGAASTVGTGRMAFRRALVAAEIGLAVVLVIGAGLLIKSFNEIQRVDPGFNANGVVTMDFSLTRADYPDPSQMARFHADLVERVEALPGVVSAGSIRVLPLRGAPGPESLTLLNRTRTDSDPHWVAQLQVAGPGFFESLAIPLLSGRIFDNRDGTNDPPVVIVNQTMAKTHWPGGDVLGAQFKLGPEDSSYPPMTVVGVVGDILQSGLDGSVAAQIFVPRQQAQLVFSPAARTASFVVRTETDPIATMAAVRRAVGAIDPQLPLANMQTMERVVSRSVSDERFMGVVMGLFSGVALVLGAVGIYGLMAYSVAQRTREIGLRVALGADQRGVQGLVVRQAMSMTVVGIVGGLAAALAASRMVSGLLFGVGVRDPVIFIGAPVLLLVVALLAAYLPARRAANVDPMVALHGG